MSRSGCTHTAGWWTDQVLLWGSESGVYLEDASLRGRRRQTQKLVLRCNMSGCEATRIVRFDRPLMARFGPIRRAAKGTK